jgi:crooked neck
VFTILILNVLLFQSEEGWEEFFDYVFPEDEATKPNLKLLEMAKTWKKQKKAEEEL